MAETPVVHIGENSPEQIAFRLMEMIANCERRSLNGGSSSGFSPADKNYILKTYAEALHVVKYLNPIGG